MTLKKGLNDDEIGKIIDFALRAALRARRHVPADPGRRAAGGLRRRSRSPDAHRGAAAILEQTTVFQPEDVIPVPCHPDALAMAYALKIDGNVIPLTGLIDPKVLIEGGRNTIVYEQDDAGARAALQAVRHQPLAAVERRAACGPALLPAGGRRCRRASATTTFSAIIIMQFIDAHAFDVRSVKKTCVHIVHPTGG